MCAIIMVQLVCSHIWLRLPGFPPTNTNFSPATLERQPQLIFPEYTTKIQMPESMHMTWYCVGYLFPALYCAICALQNVAVNTRVNIVDILMCRLMHDKVLILIKCAKIPCDMQLMLKKQSGLHSPEIIKFIHFQMTAGLGCLYVLENGLPEKGELGWRLCPGSLTGIFRAIKLASTTRMVRITGFEIVCKVCSMIMAALFRRSALSALYYCVSSLKSYWFQDCKLKPVSASSM